MTGVVAIEELRAAYLAIQHGQFRTGPAKHTPASTTPAVPAGWDAEPGRLLLVAGCMGSAGTSMVALTLATGLGDARVVECCTVTSSGLCGASSAELGTVDGWVRGSRDQVLIERRGDRIGSLAELPMPAGSSKQFTVLDSSWDIDVLAADAGWLGELARTVAGVVLVTRATVPGLRRLDTAVQLLGANRVHAVIVGAGGKRWARPVEQAISPAVRQLRLDGRLFGMPLLPAVSFDGLTPEPIPAAAVAAVADLISFWKGTRP